MARKRWIYPRDGGEPIEVTADFVNARPATATDAVLWNDRAYQDMGDPRFTTRAQHRQYMARNGLTTMDDFRDTWKQAAAKRAEFMATGRDPGRREVIARALYNQLDNRSRK